MSFFVADHTFLTFQASESLIALNIIIRYVCYDYSWIGNVVIAIASIYWTAIFDPYPEVTAIYLSMCRFNLQVPYLICREDFTIWQATWMAGGNISYG